MKNFFQDSNTSDLGSVENVATSPTSPLVPGTTLSGSIESVQPSQPELLKPPETNLVPQAKKTNSMPLPEMAMRNRAASTGSVMMARRDSSVKENEDLNRTMLFQVRRFNDDL